MKNEKFLWDAEFAKAMAVKNVIYENGGTYCFRELYIANPESCLEDLEASNSNMPYRVLRNYLTIGMKRRQENQILIYDKTDAFRRRWLNADEFASLFKESNYNHFENSVILPKMEL